MGSRGLVLARCTWFSTLLPCFLLLVILPFMVKAQFLGCSTQGEVGLENLQSCLNYQAKSSMDACCQVLNQVVNSGYHCLCSLLSSTTTSSISTPPLLLPFANCYIYVPPLKQCPGSNNAPLVLPPIIDGTELTNPPPTPTSFMPPMMLPPSLPLLPPPGIQTSMNLTQGNSSTMEGDGQPHPNQNSLLNVTMPDNISGMVRSYSYSGECRKHAKIWTYPGVVFVLVILLRTSIL